MGSNLSILYIYNVSTLYDEEAADKYNHISGGVIANGTIKIGALERFSNAFNYNDPTSLATSKALYDLYMELSSAISDWSPANIYVRDTNSSSNNKITVSTDSLKYTPRDGYKVNVVLACNKNIDSGLKISIDGVEYGILFNNDDVPDILKSGKTLKLIYNSYERKFNTYVLDQFKLSRSYISKTLNDKDTIISYDGLYNDAIHDDVIVYRNGIRLFEGLDYSVNTDDSITLNVVGEANEKIVFEKIEVISR